jgi:hypothetical protein
VRPRPSGQPGAARLARPWAIEHRRFRPRLYAVAIRRCRSFGDAYSAAIEPAFGERRVPLSVMSIADPTTAELYARRLVLVRPDGHLAWRSGAPPADPRALVDRVRGV